MIMFNAALVGSTGLVGSHILATLYETPSCSKIYNISRRTPTIPSRGGEKINQDESSEKLHSYTSDDTSDWPAKLAQFSPTPNVLFSALGTSRGAAGSIEAQRRIDYDLNLSLATSARDAGVKIYVLVSSTGANANSFFPYPKMKGELEDAVKQLGFETVVILRPGLLLGDRRESRLLEWAPRKIAGVLGLLGSSATDFWAQDATIVARAAVSAAQKALEDRSGGVCELAQSDIVRLGRMEWKSSQI